MIWDFHTHTILSDGVLSPVELIRRAAVIGYAGIGLTDHVAGGGLERIISETVQDCVLAQEYWRITAIPGVEITHAPAKSIPGLALRAKELGAKLVVVHGETINEPVEPGTNLAAVSSPHVDILAHPGMITAEVAQLAVQTGVFLELSASRSGHGMTNGHVAKMASYYGCTLLVNTDTHSPDHLLTEHRAWQIAMGAGLEDIVARTILETNPKLLLRRIGLAAL